MFLRSKSKHPHATISQVKNFLYVLAIVFLSTYLVYASLFYFFKNIAVAYFISFFIGLLINVYLKPEFVFAKGHKLKTTLIYSLYYFVYSMFCYRIIVYITSTLSISAYYSIVISSVIVFPVHFFISKLIFK